MMMQTMRLEVEENFVDKVKSLLQQLPQNTVRIKEDTVENSNSMDFFEYLVLNPINTSNQNGFLSREDATAR